VVAMVALLSIAAFIAAFSVLRILLVARIALRTAVGALNAIRDGRLADADRERATQRAAVRLFGLFLSILIRTGAALAVAFAPILLADMVQLALQADVVAFLSRWDVIALVSTALLLYYFARGREWFRR
jgi:hypothetical protein